MQESSLQTSLSLWPQPELQHVRLSSSLAEHSRLPRALHSAAASPHVTAVPSNEPVTGSLLLPWTDAAQIESKQVSGASQHWMAAVSKGSTHSAGSAFPPP